MKLPARATICEVGTRDGFQIEPDFIPTELKVEVVDLLSDAGVPLDQLESVVGRLVDMGARATGLADTTGMANPRQVARVCEHLMPRFPSIEWTLHTHDTRAMAIPNILAAMECGVTNLDGSIGGLGGCPFAPGASGNVCSEDLVHCLHAMGVELGSLLGYSAILIAGSMPPKGRLTCVEANPFLAWLVRANVAEAGLARRVKVVAGDALRAIPLLPGRFDFAFIDAEKEDYLDYVRQLEPKLVPGAIVVADNTGIARREV